MDPTVKVPLLVNIFICMRSSLLLWLTVYSSSPTSAEIKFNPIHQHKFIICCDTGFTVFSYLYISVTLDYKTLLLLVVKKDDSEFYLGGEELMWNFALSAMP